MAGNHDWNVRAIRNVRSRRHVQINPNVHSVTRGTRDSHDRNAQVIPSIHRARGHLSRRHVQIIRSGRTVMASKHHRNLPATLNARHFPGIRSNVPGVAADNHDRNVQAVGAGGDETDDDFSVERDFP
jgi:hypothetical protein